MLSVLLALAPVQDQPPVIPVSRPGKNGRGRDPWVFRCIFEDRTRMLIIAPAPDVWMAFNPETCAMHKVWQGKMDFRGKVWDFSQDNSRAEGRILFASPSEIWRLADGRGVPDGWSANGVVAEKSGWYFPTAQAKLTSPPMDVSAWHRVFLAFDETSRKGRIHIEVIDKSGGVKSQWFESATSVDSDSSWQWNFKRIERPGRAIVVSASSTVPGKRLRNLRLYGDLPSWLDATGKPLEVVWGGYELVEETKAVDIHYRVRLASGALVGVRHRPELATNGWTEKLNLAGLPAGQTLVLRREGLSKSLTIGGSPVVKDGAWTFNANGDYQLTFASSEGSR